MHIVAARAWEKPQIPDTLFWVTPENRSPHRASMQRLDDTKPNVESLAENFAGMSVGALTSFAVLTSEPCQRTQLLPQFPFISRKKMNPLTRIRVREKIA
jgi:hypothetical protein